MKYSVSVLKREHMIIWSLGSIKQKIRLKSTMIKFGKIVIS